jgi:N-methylhydantoinase A/oxoprolinase/acetone carboxylase beta subunit
MPAAGSVALHVATETVVNAVARPILQETFTAYAVKFRGRLISGRYLVALSTGPLADRDAFERSFSGAATSTTGASTSGGFGSDRNGGALPTKTSPYIQDKSAP